jgi:hypothetical protein
MFYIQITRVDPSTKIKITRVGLMMDPGLILVFTLFIKLLLFSRLIFERN